MYPKLLVCPAAAFSIAESGLHFVDEKGNLNVLELPTVGALLILHVAGQKLWGERQYYRYFLQVCN